MSPLFIGTKIDSLLSKIITSIDAAGNKDLLVLLYRRSIIASWSLPYLFPQDPG